MRPTECPMWCWWPQMLLTSSFLAQHRPLTAPCQLHSALRGRRGASRAPSSLQRAWDVLGAPGLFVTVLSPPEGASSPARPRPQPHPLTFDFLSLA